MMRGACAVLAALAAGAALLRGQAQPPQTFRTGTDVVLVDVSVRDGPRAVTGLRAEDFELTDNGVRQRIDSVEATSVPIDLTLVVDVSGSPTVAWTKPAPRARAIARIESEFAAIAKLLRREDRVRLMAVDTSVQELWPMQAVAAMPSLARLEHEGLAALYDTLAAALLQPVEPARRHVVIAATKGLDTISSVDANAVRILAQRSDALFHIVAQETALGNDAALGGFQCSLMGYCWPTRKFWVPFERRLVSGGPPYLLSPEGKAVADGAAATGGGLHQASGFSEPTLAGTFRRAFEDFRNSYVLRYTPQGVQRAGWHDIEVRLPRSRSYTVRSRSGYLVEAPASAPVTSPVPEVPRTLHELTDAYERGAYRQVVTGLRMAAKPAELLRDFAAAGNPWPAAPRKEAAFALDLVEPAVFSQDRPTREAAYEHLARFARLIRPPLEPDTFERYWYFAALTLLEGSIHPDAAESFATRALARFPDEPRFHLSRAIATDQHWATRSRNLVTDGDGKPMPAHVELVRERYTAAAAMPATAVEARIRLAWFLHRIERHEEALDQLALAGAQPVADASMRYLHHLFRGHALAALGRHDQAVEAFRAALAVVPSAQSARVALMNTLLVRGDRAGAEALAEHVQTESNEAIDPWWMYWQGQYRLQPQVMARVRELSR